ncbi:UDP-galactopyranose mutase [hydrothermal vent metagenome]|uniref:UDP-galactopyranose mutase n=1 Tax=hydrothermal vent metagenome TaxID=652676 RepID=A0A1W1BA68_9ZZZZ
MYDYIVVGAGFAGAIVAERLASQQNKKILIIEKRDHIGGNCYDEIDSSGVLVHRYGPHLFHTDYDTVYEYLSRFTKWQEYTHKVVANVDGQNIDLPFNFNTLYQIFDESRADRLKSLLIEEYGADNRVSVSELRNSDNIELRELGEFIYEKIFLNYTIKQWGIEADEIDPSVLARVPILTSYDSRYFQDRYQAVPVDGYSELFKNILSHQNITIELGRDALESVSIVDKQIHYNGTPFSGRVVFTGMVDELFGYKYGKLPYRSLDLKFEVYNMEYFQESAVVNYPNEHDYTRITEFKHIHHAETPQTTILKEYPQPYIGGSTIPYYPMPTDESRESYERYSALASSVSGLTLLGRLAEYRYYDMDDIAKRALDTYKEIL